VGLVVLNAGEIVGLLVPEPDFLVLVVTLGQLFEEIFV
jgi:hypothetical protein